MTGRVIMHIDIDNFYVACERAINPTLIGKPVGVQQKALLATCSYEAREKGVKKLSRVKEALELCPDLILVNGEDLTTYRRFSLRIRTLVKSLLPPSTPVEKLGLDELFIDISHHPLLSSPSSSTPTPSTALPLAHSIKNSIREQLGFTCSIGIGRNKMLAKLAGEGGERPDGLTVWKDDESNEKTKEWIAKMKIQKIPGFGAKSIQILKESIEQSSLPLPDPLLVSDILQLLPPSQFPPSLSAVFPLLYGIDTSPVSMTPRYPHVLSIEDSYRSLSANRLEEQVKKHMMSVIRRMEEELMSDHENRPEKIWKMWPQSVKVTLLWKNEKGRESKSGRLPIEVFDIKMTVEERSEITWNSTLKKIVEGMKKGKENDSLVIVNVAVTDLEKESLGRGIKELLIHPIKPIQGKKDDEEEERSEKIDLKVLSELPKEIQEEIIREHGVKKRDLEKSGIHIEHHRQEKRKRTQDNKNKDGDFHDFFSPKSKSKSKSKSQPHNKSDVNHKKPSIDIEMLHHLPKDLQRDLMIEYNISQAQLGSFFPQPSYFYLNVNVLDETVRKVDEDEVRKSKVFEREKEGEEVVKPSVIEENGQWRCTVCSAIVESFAVDPHLAWHLEA